MDYEVNKRIKIPFGIYYSLLKALISKNKITKRPKMYNAEFVPVYNVVFVPVYNVVFVPVYNAVLVPAHIYES